MFEPCPCGVGPSYLLCCAPIHLGQRQAAGPEELMRARYSAYARRDAAFLLKSWSARTRPAGLSDLADRVWVGLHIEATEMAGPDQGFVRFAARYRAQGREGVLRERSRFHREPGATGASWVYLDGKQL